MANAKRKPATRKTTQPHKSTAGSGGSKRKASKNAETNVRARVHKLTLRALRDHDMRLGDIPKLAQELIEGAASGLNNAVPSSSRNVLRQVVDGLIDAAATSVDSTKTIVSSTTTRVKQDAVQTVKDLKTIEGEFVTALGRAGKHLTGAAKEELDAIVRQSRRAGTRIKPAAKGVLKAADGRLLELGKETAGASGRIARSAVSTVLQGASGLLQGLGEALNQKRTHPTRKKSAKRK